MFAPSVSLTTDTNVSLTSMCRSIVIVAFVAAAVNADAVRVCRLLALTSFRRLTLLM